MSGKGSETMISYGVTIRFLSIFDLGVFKHFARDLDRVCPQKPTRNARRQRLLLLLEQHITRKLGDHSSWVLREIKQLGLNDFKQLSS